MNEGCTFRLMTWLAVVAYAVLTVSVAQKVASLAMLLTAVGNLTTLTVLWLQHHGVQLGMEEGADTSKWARPHVSFRIMLWLEFAIAIYDFSPWLMHPDILQKIVLLVQ